MLFWIIVASIVLGVKPSRRNLYILTGVVALISILGFAFGASQAGIPLTPDVLAAFGIGLAMWLAVYLVIGFVIIWLRGGSAEGDAAKGKKLDREMERIRAELAARDTQPPAAS
jgi:predicted permease